MASLENIHRSNINDTSNSIAEMVEAFCRVVTNPDIDQRVRIEIYEKKMKPFLSGDVPILTGDFRDYQDYSCDVYAFDGIKVDGKFETNVVKLQRALDEDRCSFVYNKITPFSQSYVGYMYGIGQAQRIIEASNNYPSEIANLAIFRYPHTISLITNTRLLMQTLVDIYSMVNPLKISAESFTDGNTIRDMDLFTYLIPMYKYISYWGNRIHSSYSKVGSTFNGVPVNIDFRANYSIGAKKVMLKSDRSRNESNVTVYDITAVMSRVVQKIESENGEDLIIGEDGDTDFD